ncbi:MAG: hypothetical protein ACO1Q7_02360 [Gemmatimonas sp.]
MRHDSHPGDTISDSSAELRPGYEIDCASEDVKALIVRWLDGTRLEWPGRFVIRVHLDDTNPFPDDTRESFTQPYCTVQAGPAQDTVYIVWSYAPAAAVVHPTRAEVDLWLSPQSIAHLEFAERSFLLITLVFVLRRLGWYHVHAAALVDPQGRGWLIAGNSNCGKSTTTALMASRGWKIGTDDIGFLAMRDGKVSLMSVRTRIALRPGGVALLGETLADADGLRMEQRKKDGYWPEEVGGSWAPIVTPEILAFPTIGQRTALSRSAPRATLSAIVTWSNWVLYESVFAQEYLDVLGEVARQSRCFDLTLGPDLFDDPDLLEKLVS